MLHRLAFALACLVLPLRAFACGGPVAQTSPIRLASATMVDEPTDPAVSITFLGHASFLIETPQHVTAVTDYNGINIPPFPPDIATMNHAHSSHYTDHPDPRIATVLHGWRDDGGPARIDFSDRDLHVTSLPTNIRDWGSSQTILYGNSIFVFATAGLCIAHLSHLHHELTPQDIVSLGPIDIVMAPVDGFLTLSHHELATVLDQIHAPIVIPMHMFRTDDVARFAEIVKDRYSVTMNPTPTVTLARRDIPERPEILVLPQAR